MKKDINQFLHNAEKWSNILSISAGIQTQDFKKYIWQFFYIMMTRAKLYLSRVF